MGGCTSTPVVASNAPPPPRSAADDAPPPGTGGPSSAPSSSSSSSVVAIAAVTEVTPAGREEEGENGPTTTTTTAAATAAEAAVSSDENDDTSIPSCPEEEEEEEAAAVVVVKDDDDNDDPHPANGTSAAGYASDVAHADDVDPQRREHDRPAAATMAKVEEEGDGRRHDDYSPAPPTPVKDGIATFDKQRVFSSIIGNNDDDDDNKREEDLRRGPFPDLEDDGDKKEEENDKRSNIATTATTAAANDREVTTTTTTTTMTTSTYSRCHSLDTFSAEVDEEDDKEEEEYVVASANKANETVIRDREGLAMKEEEEEVGDDNNAATTTTLDTITNKDEVEAEQTIETAEVVVVVVEGNDRILKQQKNKKSSSTIKETKQEAKARKEAARLERLAQKRRIKEEATRIKKEKERLAAEEEVRLATIIEAERLEHERVVAAEALAKVEALRVVQAEEERLAAEEMRLANVEADRLEQERRHAAEAMAIIEAQRLEREKVAAELEVARNAPILVDVHSSSMWDFRRPRAIDIQAAIAAVEDMPSVAGSEERDDDDDDDFEVKDEAVVDSIPSEVATTVIVNGSFVKVVDVRPRLSFSQRGQEARTRAMARQKKILSRAGDRLEAISETSLTNIEEAPVYHRPTDYGDGLLRHRRALIMAGGSSSAGSTKSNNDTRSIAASSTCASSSSVTRSVRRIVGDDGMERGEISSIVFYETGSTTGAAVAATNLTVGTNDAYLSSYDREEEVDSPTSVQAYLDKSAVITPTSSMDERDESVDSSTLIGQDAFDVQFFVLLLCPESRIFELVDVTTSSNEGDEANSISPHSTINDILSVVSNRCTDSRLSTKEYIGFVRPDDRMVFTSTDKKAFVSSDESEGHAFIGENDLLVAILKNYTGHQIAKISRPICRNTKFREMVRRRSSKISDTSTEGVHTNSDTGDDGGRDRSFGDESKSVRSSSDKKQRRKKHKLVKGGSAVVTTVDDLLGNRPDSNIKMKKKHSLSNEDKVGAAVYSNSLCQKLEQLSKKLNDVDDEIADEGDPTTSEALDETMTEETIAELQIDTAKTTDESIRSNDSFKMTSKMVAYELAMNIEEIFADHHVEIVAVDADEDEGGSDVDSLDGANSDDDETFFSSQSKRSGSQGMPSTLEFKTQRRRERRTDIYKEEEEDDLMMQIEAMARNADAAFESRKRIVVESPTTFIDGKSEQINNDVTKGSDASTTIEVLDSSYDEDISVTTHNDISSIAKSFSKKGRRSMNKPSIKECDALSRNFLNTSTSMVSTMVASSQGRVNEVHVLQYLGVTIVCIAANFMDKVRARGATTTASSSSSSKARGGGFGATEVVLQSAMFLAFVANGQRYMAKVTKK